MDARDYPEAYCAQELEAYGTKNHIIDKAAKEITRLRQQLKDVTDHYHAALEAEQVRFQQLAASQAREQQLREKVSELINAAPGHAGQCSGLKCREPYCYSCNDEDEADKYLQQVWDLCHSARELLKQTNTIALEAMIAKAGEVMRERIVVEMRSPFCSPSAIRAIPGVTLDDLKD